MKLKIRRKDMKKFKNKEVEKDYQVKCYISRLIPNTPEGQILRKLIFSQETILPDYKEIKKIILKYCPEENLNSEFIKI
jgi:hypothetical protein